MKGQRLTEFCQENALVIANTLFQQHKKQLYTWTSPDGQYWNQIIYILQPKMEKFYTVSKKKLEADCGTDHEILIAKFRLKMKKIGKTTRPLRYDLDQIPYDYTVEGESCSVVSDCLRPRGLCSPWNSLGQNPGVGSCSLLQGIFPTQGMNPGLPHCRWILCQLSHQGIWRILEWVANPFSRTSSQHRNQTGVSCMAGEFFTSWIPREAPWLYTASDK